MECRRAKARPEPVLRHRAKPTALSTRANSSDATSGQGRLRRVWTDPPELCVSSLVPKSEVGPTWYRSASSVLRRTQTIRLSFMPD